MQEETIYALGTGAGRAAIAVIRLSGNAVPFLLEQFTGAEPIPRLAQYVRLRDPATDETLDRGLALFFPHPTHPRVKIMRSSSVMADAQSLAGLFQR